MMKSNKLSCLLLWKNVEVLKILKSKYFSGRKRSSFQEQIEIEKEHIKVAMISTLTYCL